MSHPSLAWPTVDGASAIVHASDVLRFLHALPSAEDLVPSLVQRGVAPVWATDLDGTTWAGDIGEAITNAAIDAGALRPAAAAYLREACERYGLAARGDANADAHTLRRAFESGELHAQGARLGLSSRAVTRHYYEANLCCFAGHTVDELRAMARRLFERDGFAAQVFPGVRDVHQAAHSKGLVPHAVSASNQWIVEVAAQYVGIPPERARGMRAEVRDGVIQPRIAPPVTFGPGKVHAIADATGSARVAVAAGDAVDGTDAELLDAAELALAVEPTPERERYALARIAAGDNWRVLRYR